MAELEHLQQLMTELGPAMELAGVAEYAGEEGNECSWSLLIDDDIEVWADFDPAAAVLVLSATVAKPDAASRATVYETLLAYNGQREVTGGLVMALSGPGGEVIQSFALGLDGLDLNRLVRVIGNFVDLYRAWREALLASPDSGSEAGEPPAAPPPGGLKV